jgi:hypothetical protein
MQAAPAAGGWEKKREKELWEQQRKSTLETLTLQTEDTTLNVSGLDIVLEKISIPGKLPAG